MAKCKAVIVYFYALVSRITEQFPEKIMKMLYLFFVVFEPVTFLYHRRLHRTRSAITRRKSSLKVGK